MIGGAAVGAFVCGNNGKAIKATLKALPQTLTGSKYTKAAYMDLMGLLYDILAKVHEAGLTLKAGCGIGYEFSTMRPKGAYVSGAGAYTSGPLSFMDIYDKMCFTVSSAGGRRGAQMGTFDIGHPDAMDFIRAKREAGRLRQFNLSLLVTDEFIRAVRDDRDWQLAFPVREAETAGQDTTDRSRFVWREWPDASNYVRNDDGEGTGSKEGRTLL